jgi:arginine/lysine/histidine transporter system substrate-binding protein
MNKTIIFGVILAFLAIFAGWYFFKLSSCVVKKENVLIVGTNAEYPPCTFIEQGTIVGFDIDLINEVAHRLGKKVEFHDMPFTTLLPQLQLGTIQVIAAGMSPTPERAQQVLFTKPHVSGSKFLIISRKPNIAPKNLEELKDKDVVANEGFVIDAYLNDHGVVTRKLPTVADAFLALKTGRAQVFVTAENTVKPFFDLYGTEEFDMQPLPGAEESTAFAICKEHPELVKEINKILDQIKDDGTLETLRRKWGV